MIERLVSFERSFLDGLSAYLTIVPVYIKLDVNLIIVTQSPVDKYDRAYLDFLNTQYSLSIGYLQFDYYSKTPLMQHNTDLQYFVLVRGASLAGGNEMSATAHRAGGQSRVYRNNRDKKGRGYQYYLYLRLFSVMGPWTISPRVRSYWRVGIPNWDGDCRGFLEGLILNKAD